MPQADVRLQARTAQVEVAVAQPDVLRHRAVLGDLKRRRLRFVEQTNLAGQHFHFAGRQLRIHRLVSATLHVAGDADDKLRAESLGDGHQRVVFADHHLRDAGAVANIEKRDAAEVADAVHPAKQHDVGADVGGTERATGMRSSEVA